MKTSWAYGVITVPERLEALLPSTLKSLKRAGFDKPWIFMDGLEHSKVQALRDKLNLDVTARFPRIRAYGNWILSLGELYIRNPVCTHYALFQDDILAVYNLRKYLSSQPYPANGYWNLHTYLSNEPVVHKKPQGWYEGGLVSGECAKKDETNQTGRGAQALVFSREGVQMLLCHQHTVMRPTDPARGWRNIDGAVVAAMNMAGWREYIHNPSLVAHVGTDSIMMNREYPLARTWPGEEFDALSLLKPVIQEAIG
jgi:hypothetical protein